MLSALLVFPNANFWRVGGGVKMTVIGSQVKARAGNFLVPIIPALTAYI